jgi:hypothetical protein
MLQAFFVRHASHTEVPSKTKSVLQLACLETHGAINNIDLTSRVTVQTDIVRSGIRCYPAKQQRDAHLADLSFAG